MPSIYTCACCGVKEVERRDFSFLDCWEEAYYCHLELTEEEWNGYRELLEYPAVSIPTDASGLHWKEVNLVNLYNVVKWKGKHYWLLPEFVREITTDTGEKNISFKACDTSVTGNLHSLFLQT